MGVWIPSANLWVSPVYAWCSSAQLWCGIVSAFAYERNEI
jgi:hypothetical protein